MMGKDRPSLTAKGKPRLQLKGRIYMANVTDIVCLQKPGKHSAVRIHNPKPLS